MHRTVRKHIEGGTCLQYGARMLNEGERLTDIPFQFLLPQPSLALLVFWGPTGYLTPISSLTAFTTTLNNSHSASPIRRLPVHSQTDVPRWRTHWLLGGVFECPEDQGDTHGYDVRHAGWPGSL